MLPPETLTKRKILSSSGLLPYIILCSGWKHIVFRVGPWYRPEYRRLKEMIDMIQSLGVAHHRSNSYGYPEVQSDDS